MLLVMVYRNVLDEPGVNPVMEVVGLLGETMVPEPDTTVHNPVSLVSEGGLAEKTVEDVLSQNILVAPPAEVIACVAAGTVMLTSSDPLAHGPETVHLKV